MNNSNPSICFISPFMGPLLVNSSTVGTGGAERQFFLFGRELVKRGWRVVYIAQRVDGDLLSDQYEVIWVNFSYLGGSKRSLPKSLIELDGALKKSCADYYVLKTAHTILPSIFIHKYLRSGKIIFWGQTSTDFDLLKEYEKRWLRIIRHYTIRKADYIITQTKDQTQTLFHNFQRFGFHVPNIIDTSIKISGLTSNNYVFWCGNTSQNKRPEIFIELARLNPTVHFVMAANLTSAEKGNLLKTKAGLIKNLQFLGSISFAEVQEWFTGSIVYVNTSIREGFPNTFLQAWQQGVPVLSVNINPDQIFSEFKLGICVFNNKDHLKLDDVLIAKAITPPLKSLIKHKTSYNDSCIRYVNENHSPQLVCSKLLNVLEMN